MEILRIIRNKKTLSLLLALCMLTGLMPILPGTTTAQAAEPKRSLYYNFKKGNIGNSSWDYIHTNGISYGNTTVGHGDELNIGIPSDPWEFHSYGGTPASGATSYVISMARIPAWFYTVVRALVRLPG